MLTHKKSMTVMKHFVLAAITGIMLFSSTSLVMAQGLTNEFKFTPENYTEQGLFGSSISISGEYALVGAPYDGKKQSGVAYVFRHEDNVWVQQAKLVANDGGFFDSFGYSVALSDNYAVIGSPSSDTDDMNTGGVYIFRRNGDSWIQQAKLLPDEMLDCGFGWSVAISGEYVLIGAHYAANDKGIRSGAAYVFHLEGDSWVLQAKLTDTDGDGQDGDYLGEAVALSGNYAFVGAPRHKQNNNKGAVYVFHREGNSWKQQTKMMTNSGGYGYFGGSVSVDGNALLVGDEGNNTAYLFHQEGEVWTQQAEFTGELYDSFGKSVALSGNYALIGAISFNHYTGAVYLFHKDGETWTQQTKYAPSDLKTYDGFGYAVALSGTTALVGIGDQQSFMGAVYAYTIVPTSSAGLSFEDWMLTVNGETYQPGDALPSYFDTSNFDWETGQGSISMHFAPGAAGDYSIQASFDYLFSGVLDQYAFSTDTVGTLADGQVLDMTQTGADVTATLSWDFSLAGDTDWAEIRIVLGDSVTDAPYSVFTYTGSEDGTLAISSSAEVHSTPGTVPEPSTLLLLGAGLLGAIALRRKYRRR